MNWKYFIAWLPGIPIAIANGSLRQFLFMHYMDELTAHQLSVITFILLFGFYVWYILPWLKLTSNKQAIYTGQLWLILTVLFEFVFGHWVMGHSWDKLFYDYNLFEGRLWILVLLWILMAPWFLFTFGLQRRK